MTHAIRFDHFTKAYRGREVVSGLDFAVQPGTIVGLLGPNGAGKSTALKGLVGLLRPSSGAVLVEGRRFQDLENPASVVGVHMDGFGFEGRITARRHLQICALAAGAPGSRVQEVLDEVDLAAHATLRVKHFSTGMRQRLGLAAALLGRPRILVLDEPANGLDPEGIRWLRRFLKSFAREGGAVLVSSHQLAELAQTVDEVVVLRHRLLYSGPLDELLGSSDASLEERYFDLVDSAVSGEAR
ncbi:MULTISPECIES: ABC transporter ATP-binding protein [unclassified Rathayibacter]|uniref:ABC transporter ATP-binding protein n=1 Tax=unclassified Rathayibacter TaxID=2609250 RepID=UPI00188C1A9D|nr:MULTISPECIES: ATP-binding cassette domain-containing protein [unclassified Rathayibacter]MBF4461836.1 ATP-binding cassette domain-containing protein [Rathayibacter sp. VKM Ac-2879]MBF4503249.1 ATP-binding cassette domain-containing protein [Rathayibacter sp. VKM Ac-2878]